MKRMTALVFSIALSVGIPANAEPSTSDGEISAAQVLDLIRRAPDDTAARNAAMAYLAGVGEASGLLVAEIRRRAPDLFACSGALAISDQTASAALMRIDRRLWAETAATPVLIEDMFSRAGCREF